MTLQSAQPFSSVCVEDLLIMKETFRPIWVTGVDAEKSEEVGKLIRHFHGQALTWDVHPQSDIPLETYAGIRGLLEQLIPIVRKEQPQLIDEYRAVLEYVCPTAMGRLEPLPSPLSAHAVTFAIIRRISRESLHIASHIDGTARFILRARRQCPSLSADLWCLLVHRFDLWDRPSLRILYRLHLLSTPQDALRLIGLCRGNPVAEVRVSAEEEIRVRLALARRRLFGRLQMDLNPFIVAIGQCQEQQLPMPLSSMGKDEDYVLRVGENLVEQNYDQAYLLAEGGLHFKEDREIHADLHRLIGLVDANVGEHVAARQSIQKAITLAPSAELRAHLHYLIGLLYVKRDYDFDLADQHFQEGLKILDTSAEKGSSSDFERAWLINGRALVHSLRAKSLPQEEQKPVLEAIIREEMSAFRLAGKGKEPHLVYLRYNLLANIAFLLEIVRDYSEAIRFWERAFGLYLGKGTGHRFEPVYLYRIGILLWKSGNAAESIPRLQRARESARTLDDRFLEERILYGLSYILLQEGRWKEALEHFRSGLQLAWDLRELGACASHSSGLYQAAKKLKDETSAEEAYRITQSLNESSPASDMLDVDQPLPPPSPKLPAYLPSIDLEPSPDIDLNRYLVSQNETRLFKRES